MTVLLLDQSETEIRSPDDGALWAVISPIDVARTRPDSAFDAWLNNAARRSCPRVVLRPGTPPEPVREAGGSPENEQIESGMRAWGGAGREFFFEGLRIAGSAAAKAGMSLLVHPHIGTLISDIPGVLGVVRRFENVGVLLEPAAILPPDRASHASDFFDRVGTMIEIHRPAGMVLGNLYGRPLDSGPFDPRILAPLVRAAIDVEIPLVLRGDRAAAGRQLASLGDPSIGYS